MRRPFLFILAFSSLAFSLFACDMLKKNGGADAAADAAAPPPTAVATPTDTSGTATATPTAAATLGGAKPGTVVAPKTDGGGAVADGGTVADGGVKTDGGAIPSPTFTIPTFDAGAFKGFDAGAFIPPGFDAGGFKLPGQK